MKDTVYFKKVYTWYSFTELSITLLQFTASVTDNDIRYRINDQYIALLWRPHEKNRFTLQPYS